MDDHIKLGNTYIDEIIKSMKNSNLLPKDFIISSTSRYRGIAMISAMITALQRKKMDESEVIRFAVGAFLKGYNCRSEEISEGI